MITKQDIQLQLLGELDDICSKNDLKYIFYGNNALNLYNNNTIKNGSKVVSVAMTNGDIERFCKIIEKKHGKNRYVEGIFNNPYYVPFYVSYGNKNTTNFQAVKLNRNKHHGINIRLYPICKYADKKGRKLTRWDFNLNDEKEYRQDLVNPLKYNDSFKEKLLIKVHPFTKSGRNYYKQYKEYNAIDKWEDIQNYSKVRISQKIFSSDLLKDTIRFCVSETSVLLPKKTDAFFTKIYGKNFKNKKIKHQKQSMREIIDTEIGYQQIMKENKGLINEAIVTTNEIEVLKNEVKNEKEVIANLWRLVKMTDKQIEFKNYFDDNVTNELLTKDLNNQEQLNEVYQELKPAINTLKKYSEYDLTFSINPKIDTLIEKVLLKKKKKKIAKKIKELLKKEFLIE